MSKFPRIDWRFTWIGLAMLASLIKYFLSLNPTFTEIVYSRGIFPVFRWVFDFSLGLSPIPLLYMAMTALVVWAVLRIRKGTKPEVRPFRNRLASVFLSITAAISIIIFFFFILWGYNYSRVPIEQQFELNSIQYDTARIKAEALLATQELIEARKQIPRAGTAALDQQFLSENLEASIRPSLQKILRGVGYPTPGRARCRQIYPRGWMMRLGATGIYIPHLGEGHIDGGLHPIAKPFTMAHEMSHAYGFGDEGTANFLAYLSTQSSNDPFIVYSGRFAYWRYAAGQLYTVDENAFQQLIDQLPAAVRLDWETVRKTHAQYPEFFPIIFDKIYDSFLKSQGVLDGKQSYTRVVSLVMAWRERKG